MNLIKTLTLAALLPCAATVSAHEGLSASQSVIGYTTTDEIAINKAAFGQAGTYTIGAVMPSSMLADFKGCKIIGIRVASGMDLGRTSFTLCKNGAGSPEQLHTQKQRVYEGWNNVFFTGYEYVITGEEELFYGFDYTETDAMVTAEAGAICATGGYDVNNSFVQQVGNNYYQISGVGSLCIQMIVDITDMPKQRMSMGFFDNGFKYKKPGEGLEIFTQISNTGAETVNNFRVVCKIDDDDSRYIDVEETLAYGQSSTVNKTFNITDLPLGGHSLYVYVDKINGVDYADGINRGVGAKFAVYNDALPRESVFVEVYADQNNRHTASVADAFAESYDYLGDKMILLYNFRPGNSLAVDGSSYLHDLYAYTWPSFTSNRSHFPGENNVAYDVNQYIDQMPFLIPTIIEEIVEQDITTPSFADVQLESEIADGRQLTVKAKGNILPEAKSIYGDLALTLMLVEDKVNCKQQTSSGNKRYTHSNVLRAYITPATGKTLDCSRTTYEETFTLTVPEDFDADNLSVVGVLCQAGTPTPATLDDFDVTKASKTKVVNNMSGIENINDDAQQGACEYYTLSGERVHESDLSKGIYIRVNADGSHTKIMR